MSMRRCKGFTLIELLVVMAIVVLLAGVGMTLYGTSVTRAKEAALSEDLFQMRKAIDRVLRGQTEVSELTGRAREREVPPRDQAGPVYVVGGDLADDDVGAGRGQSVG